MQSIKATQSVIMGGGVYTPICFFSGVKEVTVTNSLFIGR